jgi:hypothetical protein
MPRANPTDHVWLRMFFLVIAANAIVFFSMFILLDKSHQSYYASILSPEEYVCDDVTVGLETWIQDGNPGERIDVSLAMYSADLIDKECLEMEAQRSVAFEEDMDKAYLAKAFVYEENYEISNKYLEEVCKINEEGEACLITKVMNLWNENKWDEASDLLKTNEAKKSFSSVWAIKHFDKIQEFEESLQIISQMFPNRILGDFLSQHKTLALKGLELNQQNDLLFETVYQQLSSKDRIDFLARSCYRDLAHVCGKKVKSCQLLVKSDDVPFYLDEESMLVVSYIKAARCSQADLDDVIADFKNRIEDPKLQLYMAAQKAESLNKDSVSKEIYKSIVQNSESTSIVNVEARLRLLELVSSDSDINEQFKLWQQDEKKSPYYKMIGVQFLNKLLAMNKYKESLIVANKLKDFNSLSKEARENLVIAFYENGKLSEAKKYLTPQVNSRSLASSSRIDEIRKILSERVK